LSDFEFKTGSRFEFIKLVIPLGPKEEYTLRFALVISEEGEVFLETNTIEGADPDQSQLLLDESGSQTFKTTISFQYQANFDENDNYLYTSMILVNLHSDREVDVPIVENAAESLLELYKEWKKLGIRGPFKPTVK